MHATRRIFITGASSGIGLSTARALCARGDAVWGTSRVVEKLPGIENFHPVLLDLNDSSSIEAGYRQAEREAGYFDVLINNAGAGVFGPLEAFSDREIAAQIDTLLLGPLRLIRLALPGLRARGAGLVINVSSLAGEFPVPFLAPYSLCKAALSAMSEALVLELAHTNVRVVDVRPGDFATAFHAATRRIGEDLAAAYAPNLERAWSAIERNMNRAPDPQQAADTVVKIVAGEIRAPVVAVGDLFQARIAPFLSRRSPRAWVQWGIRRYYGMKGRS
jgi:NAD(P)-dependent dehydrogenase (short-subunit alcohol dehydrogenase family)